MASRTPEAPQASTESASRGPIVFLFDVSGTLLVGERPQGWPPGPTITLRWTADPAIMAEQLTRAFNPEQPGAIVALPGRFLPAGDVEDLAAQIRDLAAAGADAVAPWSRRQWGAAAAREIIHGASSKAFRILGVPDAT